MQNFAKVLSSNLKKLKQRHIIFLFGDLGVGKTTLTQNVLKNLGVIGRVKSPTYTLIEAYESPYFKIYHIDLYRLQDKAELEFLGISDLLQEPALFIVEWPEKLAALGIQADLSLTLSLLDDESRRIQIN
jgi:tRNA threonylcarbamoyladenosine biosynthesis protein TsaE